MRKTYNDCIHYFGGYCELSKNGFGINNTCCERNDCPDAKFLDGKETKNCSLSQIRDTHRKKEKK